MTAKSNVSNPSLIRDACVNGGFAGADKLYFRDTNTYVQSDASGYLNLVAATGIKLNSTALTATGAEINAVADASGRIVTLTTTSLSLTVATHGDRVILVDVNSTVANTLTLPDATGSGAKFTIINNIAQTQGTVVITCNTTNVMEGIAYNFGSTEEAAECFHTSATSDKITLNLTTTGGGVGHDSVEIWDTATSVYTVRAFISGSGGIATPFSAT